jgi:putative transposase
MKYDPDVHHRRSIRLRDYDYARAGAYFVTTCVQGRKCLFGEIIDGKIRLSEFGRVAWECWDTMPEHFRHVRLDVFVVMPNHVHGILFITSVGATHASPKMSNALTNPAGPKQRSLGVIVGSFKSAATKRVNALRGTPGMRVWQRNYYEHVIRDEEDLRELREYIVNNPLRWELDQLHPDNPSKW